MAQPAQRARACRRAPGSRATARRRPRPAAEAAFRPFPAEAPVARPAAREPACPRNEPAAACELEQRLDPLPQGRIAGAGFVQVAPTARPRCRCPGPVMKIERSIMRSSLYLQCGNPRPITPRNSRSIAARGAATDFLVQPGPGIGPQAVGRPRRNAEHLGRFGEGQAGKKAELDQLGRRLDRSAASLFRASSRASRSSGISGIAISMPSRSCRAQLAAPLAGLLAAGAVDQDPPHRLGRGGEEVAADCRPGSAGVGVVRSLPIRL